MPDQHTRRKYKFDRLKSHEDYRRKYMQKDGRYGWLVVGATFMVGFITDGLTFSFGVLLIELIRTFNKGRAATAIIGSLITGVMHLIGVGAFAFNLITGYLLEIYGWRGAVLIQSGLLLNGIVCGLILVAPVSVEESEQREEEMDERNNFQSREHNSDCGNELYDGIQGAKIPNNESDINIKYIKNGRGGINIDHEENNESKGSLHQTSQGIAHNHDSLKTFISNSAKPSENSEFVSTISMGKYTDHNSEFLMYDLEIPFQGSSKNSIDNNSEKVTNVQVDTNKEQGLDTDSTSGSVIDKENIIRQLCNLTLLRDKNLLAFLLSGFMVNLAFTVPFNLIADQAVENDMTKHEAYWLASSIGISNTVSRVIIGWIADRKFINRLVLLISLLTLVGISTIVSVFMISFTAKMVYTCVFGFLVGGYVTLCPVVLVDLFGEDVIARSYGLFWFAVGISGLVSTPIAGLLFDRTGSYVISFITAGSEFILGAVVLLFPFYYVRRKMNKETCNF